MNPIQKSFPQDYLSQLLPWLVLIAPQQHQLNQTNKVIVSELFQETSPENLIISKQQKK